MQALTANECTKLTRLGYGVLMGNAMEPLVPAAAALGGSVVLVAAQPACVDARGYVQATELISFAAVSDGVLIQQIGINRARRGTWARLADELYRRWALRNVVSTLNEHCRRA